MHEQERDKLKKEKDDVLLLNQQMSLAVKQQTEEKVSRKTVWVHQIHVPLQ